MIFVLFCDPFKTLPSIKAFSLDGTSKLSTTPNMFHVTHVEVKNPVGSDIEKSSCNGYSDIIKQGNKIGDNVSK